MFLTVELFGKGVNRLPACRSRLGEDSRIRVPEFDISKHQESGDHR
jgi:hypothetical protein